MRVNTCINTRLDSPPCCTHHECMRTLNELEGSQLDPKLALWEQVAIAIETGIRSSGTPGMQLPSEADQRARHGVSRVTLRQALHHLQDKGLVESSPGRGWFIRDERAYRPPSDARKSEPRPLFEPPGKLMSFTEMARSRGLTPDSVVLEQRVRPATFDEAEALAIAPGADVFLLRRLRRLNGLAVALDQNLIPFQVLPGALIQDFTKTSLHAAFHSAGATPVVADAEVEAVVADAEQARLLEAAEGFPLLKVRQNFFDAQGRTIERGVIVYRGDRYRYRTRLVP
ncbi:GntR family transcriptional regulator [Cryobacterium psychrotolerans]|nr:GntR family transcriptional regulator [Cryobacterium psychrotolerans]